MDRGLRKKIDCGCLRCKRLHLSVGERIVTTMSLKECRSGLNPSDKRAGRHSKQVLHDGRRRKKIGEGKKRKEGRQNCEKFFFFFFCTTKAARNEKSLGKSLIVNNHRNQWYSKRFLPLNGATRVKREKSDGDRGEEKRRCRTLIAVTMLVTFI